MSSKATAFFIFTALVSQAHAANGLVRVTTNSPLKKDTLIKILPGMKKRDILKILKSQGITTDEKSKIYIHEEENTINLTCFKCLVRILPEDQLSSSAYNERALK